MNEETLATELLREVKASAKRWFIISMIELFAIVVLVIMLFVVPTEEYTIDQQSSKDSYNQIIGGDYNGKTDSNLQKTESQTSK